jgi:nitrate/nitrite transporter NarK
MMASISSQYWHYILSQGLLTGIGLGSSFSPALACVSSYYRRKRGLANGLLSAGSAIGGLIIPIYLSKMINNQSIGLAWSLRTSGFICFVLQGSAVLLLQQKTTAPSDRPLFDISIFRQRAYAITTGGLFLTTAAVFVSVVCPSAIRTSIESASDVLTICSTRRVDTASLLFRGWG